MSDDFDGPASTTGIQWDELNGALLLFTVDKVEDEMQTNYGKASPIRASLVVLDGAKGGEEYADTLVFPKVLIGQLRPKAGGGKVLGRLGQGQKKPGQSAPWMLVDPTEPDKQTARAYLAKATTAPPF